MRQRGWRVYVTTQPPAQLSLQEAVLAYRHEYVVERAMGRLKGRPLSLTPMYLERDDHATGLIRLLSMGLRVLTRLEFGVAGAWPRPRPRWPACRSATRSGRRLTRRLNASWRPFKG